MRTDKQHLKYYVKIFELRVETKKLEIFVVYTRVAEQYEY